jgi:hypothetical protein
LGESSRRLRSGWWSDPDDDHPADGEADLSQTHGILAVIVVCVLANLLVVYTEWFAAFVQGLFFDVPWVLDSAFRRAEFNLNKTYRLSPPGATAPPPSGGTMDPWTHRPRVVQACLLGTILVFVMYGPTVDALCSVMPPWTRTALEVVLFLYRVVGVLGLFFLLYQLLARYERRRPVALFARRLAFKLGIFAIALLFFGIGARVEYLLHGSVHDPRTCLAAHRQTSALVQLVVTVVLLAGVFVASTIKRRDALPPIAFLVIIAGLLAIDGLSDGSAAEANHAPYLTISGIVIAALLLLVLGAKFLATRIVVPDDDRSKWKATLVPALGTCELFVDRGEPTFHWTRVLYAIVGAPFTHPFVLLLGPSLTTLLSSPENVSLWFWCSFAIAWFLLALGSVSTRWNFVIDLVVRWFLTGIPLLVTVVVMALALARVFGISYVGYIIDAAPFGVLTATVVMSYTVSWFLETVLNQPVQIEILRLMTREANTDRDLVTETEERIPCDINPSYVTTKVPASGRYLQIHGLGRFAVVAAAPDGKPCFHTYDKLELIERLVAHTMKGRAIAGTLSHRPPGIEDNALLDMLDALRRRIRTYFGIANLLIGALLGLVVWCAYSSDKTYVRSPVVKASPDAAGTYSLLCSLNEHARARRTAILLAASGGGTRAALFATSALRGLAANGHGPDILLASGASGGGAALAYFAAHRDRLLKSTPSLDASAWCDFEGAMSYPHIADVLEGGFELRMLRDQPLGSQLAHSFERAFSRRCVNGGGELLDLTERRRTNLGDISDMGLILNTTITAHPYSDSRWLRTLFGDPNPTAQGLAYARFSGGRLSFTNLIDKTPFPQEGRGRGDDNDFAPDFNLTFKVVQDPLVPLASAAALNANFPPVFSNSGVWLEHAGSIAKYYVTDGGVNENRGLVSLLYAFDGVLIHEIERRNASRTATDSTAQDSARLPELKALDAPTADPAKPCREGAPAVLGAIDIIALEASTEAVDYSQDRGVGALLGGGPSERLAGGLERTLYERVCEHAKALGGGCEAKSPAPRIALHYLTMPAVFTARGGFGTHWLLPDSVWLTNPTTPIKDRKGKRLDGATTEKAIMCLFLSKDERPHRPDCEAALQNLDPWLVDVCRRIGEPGTCSDPFQDLLAELDRPLP